MAKTFNISLPEQLVDELDRRARVERRSRSEVLRAAALAYLDWWNSWQELRRYGAQRARRLRLAPDDVDRLIAGVRKRRRS